MNYTELNQALQDYVESTETSFVANIPMFVRQAEERIYRSVMIPELRKNATASTTLGSQYLARPSDFLAVFSMAVVDADGDYTYLYDKDVNFIREAFPNPTDVGTPTHYAQFDSGTLLLGPTPDLSYAVELHYYYYPASIVTAGTSWVGDNFETVLLYGSLREAYQYMKGEEDITAQYENKYQEALALLKVLGDGKDRRDAYRSGQTRVPVP